MVLKWKCAKIKPHENIRIHSNKRISNQCQVISLYASCDMQILICCMKPEYQPFIRVLLSFKI